MTWSEFVSEVEDDNVTDVYIEQSRAVPTGIVTLELKDDNSTRKVNVSNVEEVDVPNQLFRDRERAAANQILSDGLRTAASRQNDVIV